MIISKSSLDAAKLASVDKAVPVLNNLCIRPDGGVVAANGKSMIFVSPVLKEIKEKVPLEEHENLEDVVLSLETVGELMKAVPKDTMFKGVLEHLEVRETGTEGEVLVKVTDGKRHKDIRCKGFGRRFVDTDRILDEVLGSQELGRVAVNLRRFLTVVEVLVKVCPDNSGEVPLYLEFYEKATILRTVNIKTGQRAVAIVYNYRPDSLVWMEESDWEKIILKREDQ
jgi:hypothetical protein